MAADSRLANIALEYFCAIMEVLQCNIMVNCLADGV